MRTLRKKKLDIQDRRQYDTAKLTDVAFWLPLSTSILQVQNASVIQRYWSRMNHLK
jgi:hypothetical protein